MSGDLREMGSAALDRRVGERQSLQCRETLDYFVSEAVDRYDRRSASYWDREYGSIEAFLESVEPNRERLRGDLGVASYEDDEAALDPQSTTVLETEGVRAERLAIRLFEGNELRGRAILGVPTDDGPHPLVICQHGAGSSPETVFGFGDEANVYHSYGRRLVEAGYAVLAPLTLNGLREKGSARHRAEMIAHMLGRSVFGLEVYTIGRFLDHLEGRAAVDVGRTGMWGVSMGGTTTQFTVALEERIDAAVSTAWFNHRPKKMVLEDPRFTAFLPVEEYPHFYVPGWLREFSDADLISLVCPRPLLIQSGRADGIDWRPYLEEEFERARGHYERLGIEDRIDACLHEGGHEIEFDSGRAFLDEHLR